MTFTCVMRRSFTGCKRNILLLSRLSTHANLNNVIADKIRNVGIVAHIDAGKTTTTENMLFLCGEIKQLGRVDTGDTTMDFLPQERERGITISSATKQLKWKQNIINVIDTPGHVDFTFEVSRSARVLDGVVVVIDAVAGVQAQTQTVWKQTVRRKHGNSLPAIAFINKMDRNGADFDRSVLSMCHKLNANAVPIQFPITRKDEFEAVVDLIAMNKYTWRTVHTQSTSNSPLSSRTPVSPIVTPLESSDEFYGVCITRRQALLERLAELDEEYMEVYLNGTDTVSDILHAIKRLCRNNSIIPVLCGASLRGKGVESLLDAISVFLPPPNYNPSVTGKNYQLIHKLHPDSRLTLTPDPHGPLCAMIFKVVFDTHKGYLSFIRVFSGTITNKSTVFNSTKGLKERVGQLCRVQADDLESLEEISAGDVGCIVGLKHSVTGDTLVSGSGTDKIESGKGVKIYPISEYVLGGLTIPEPVYSLSIEPDKASQQPALEKALTILTTEDPSLQVEYQVDSGLTLIKGLGELHLEIVLDKLRRTYNLEVSTGMAYVGYKETLMGIDSLVIPHTYDRVLGNRRLYAHMEFEVSALGSTAEGGSTAADYASPATWSVEEECKKGLSIVAVAGVTGADLWNAITDAFQYVFIRGPQGYPITGISVRVLSLEKHPDCTPGAVKACIATFMEQLFKNPLHYCKLEPIMYLEVEVPQLYMGEVLNDLCTRRRATVREVISADGVSTGGAAVVIGGSVSTSANGNVDVSNNTKHVIIGEVPLVTMLGYATIIRSMTQGEGSFSMEYHHHAP